MARWSSLRVRCTLALLRRTLLRLRDYTLLRLRDYTASITRGARQADLMWHASASKLLLLVRVFAAWHFAHTCRPTARLAPPPSAGCGRAQARGAECSGGAQLCEDAYTVYCHRSASLHPRLCGAPLRHVHVDVVAQGAALHEAPAHAHTLVRWLQPSQRHPFRVYALADAQTHDSHHRASASCAAAVEEDFLAQPKLGGEAHAHAEVGQGQVEHVEPQTQHFQPQQLQPQRLQPQLPGVNTATQMRKSMLPHEAEEDEEEEHVLLLEEADGDVEGDDDKREMILGKRELMIARRQLIVCEEQTHSPFNAVVCRDQVEAGTNSQMSASSSVHIISLIES